jgi:hypothetical protein
MEIKAEVSLGNISAQPELTIQLILNDEEEGLLNGFLETSIKETLPEIRKANKLGFLIYSEIKSGIHSYDTSSEHYIVRWYPVEVENNEIVNEKHIKEIADILSRHYARLLAKAIDLPEINETIAEVKLPEIVKEEIEKRHAMLDYGLVISLIKKAGFNDFIVRYELKHDGIGSTIKIRNILSSVHYMFDVGYDVDTDDNKYRLSLIPIFDKGDFTVRVREWSKEAIEKQAREIKERILSELDKVIKSNALNLIAAVSYFPLSRTINIERKNESISAYVSRYTLFDPVKVSISLHSKKRAKYSRILLDIEGVSKRIVLNKRTPGEYQINNVPASVTFENINIIEDTINRLLAGDFSVIDEVEQRNQTIVESLTKQLQEQKIEYFNDVPEEIEPVEVNVDVLDFMSDEQRQKLITYLVASKLKSSEGD